MNELDELRLQIAKAQGWKREFGRMDRASSKDHEYFIRPNGTLTMYPPDWPRDIAAAWELVEEVCTAGYEVTIPYYQERKTWGVDIQRGEFGADGSEDYFTEADTVTEAICRAWLTWKEHKP